MNAEPSFTKTPRALALLAWLMLAFLLTFAVPAQAQEGVPCVPEPEDMLIEYGDLVSCAFDEIGDVDAFVFSGAAGSTIRVQASRLGGDTPCFQVFAPDGAALDFARCGP